MVDDECTFDELKKQNLYSEQFKEDFSTFLKLRSKELIFGGRMVLTIAGRVNNSEYKDSFYMLGLLRLALNDMISEVRNYLILLILNLLQMIEFGNHVLNCL